MSRQTEVGLEKNCWALFPAYHPMKWCAEGESPLLTQMVVIQFPLAEALALDPMIFYSLLALV